MFHVSALYFTDPAEAARHLLLAAHRSVTTAHLLDAT
jgi:hypothetical protein